MSKEELRKIFIKTEDCQFCGSQRCDCSEEWMEGCRAFKEFCKKYEEDNINLELHKIKQKNPEKMKRMMKDIERNMNYSKIKELLDKQGITIEEDKDEDNKEHSKKTHP